MTIKSLGNTLATFKDIFGRTGNRASNPIFTGFSVTSSGTIATPASGLAPGNGYKYHTFTSPGTFSVSSGTGSIEIIVVGGGGGGGLCHGGGGGAGGLVFHPSVPVVPGTYAITIGSGGGPLSPPTAVPSVPYSGTPSTFAPGSPVSLTALGGGGGGSFG